MWHTTLLSADGTIIWTSAPVNDHTPEELAGESLWKLAQTDAQRKEFREILAGAMFDGEHRPTIITFEGTQFELRVKRVGRVKFLCAKRLIPRQKLSKREREILLAICADKKPQEIADDLGISVNTIEAHRGRLKAKLGCEGTAGLVRWAIRYGLIVP